MSSTATEPTAVQAPSPPAEGDLVTATVYEVGPEQVVVGLGEARWPLARAELAHEPKVGEELEVFLDGDPRTHKLVASRHKAEVLHLWDTLLAAAEKGEVRDGEVVALVKGGLSVDIGVRAFMPASQASLRPSPDLAPLLGKRVPVKLLEFDRRRGRVVVSHRAVLEAERAVRRGELLQRLREGDVVAGTVVSFVPYGAFVDIGGVDGLLHLEDMSWGHVRHGSQLLTEGQALQVKVLEIQRDKGRVGLGLKQLTADPWVAVPERYRVGGRAQAKVLRLTEFGAFVELEPNVEGLVHISEMRWGKAPRKPSEVVSVGQTVEVEVLDVDQKERRIALGMRQLTPNPWRALRERHHRGAKVSGVVRSVVDYGVFVELETGVDGLLHASDMSWTERVRPADRYKVGDTLEVALLEVDVGNERIQLGVKQLTEDPWVAATTRLPPGSKVKGKVKGVTDFGAFVELAPGVEGLCHVTELTEDRDARPADVVKPGDELEVVVLDADPQSRRISLSVLALNVPEPEAAAPTTPQGSFSNSLGDKLAKTLGGK